MLGYRYMTTVMYTDSTRIWSLIDDLVAASSGFLVGLIGQLVTDLVTSAITGQWSWVMIAG